MAMATKKTRIKTEAAGHHVPQSRDEVVRAIRHLGALQGERQRRKADMDADLQKIKQDFAGIIEPINDKMKELLAGIHTYCEAHRDELTDGGRSKTVRLPSGEISWRNRPPSVRIRNNGQVIDAIKRLGLGREFLRITEQISKEAMLGDLEKANGITGVTIGSAGEDFVVKPAEIDLEEIYKK